MTIQVPAVARIAICAFSFMVLAHPGLVLGQQEEVKPLGAHGYDNLRIEQEDRLSAPVEKAEEIWWFMHQYFVEDQSWIKQLDPEFAATYSAEDFTDTYFDTPSLQALAGSHGIRYRRRLNLTNPNDRKSGRELLQIKISGVSGSALQRGEVKFEIDHRSNMKTQEARHPMIGLVRPAHREGLRTRLADLGMDAESMRPILTIQDRRTRVYILKDGKPFMSISHDKARSELLWAKFEMVEIEPELNEIAYTEAGPETRAYMEKIGAAISARIKEEFPYLVQDLSPKYNRAFAAFESQIPFLRLLVRTNMIKQDHLFAALFALVFVIGGAVHYARKALAGRHGRISMAGA